jgi:hypothetical protein
VPVHLWAELSPELVGIGLTGRSSMAARFAARPPLHSKMRLIEPQIEELIQSKRQRISAITLRVFATLESPARFSQKLKFSQKRDAPRDADAGHEPRCQARIRGTRWSVCLGPLPIRISRQALPLYANWPGNTKLKSLATSGRLSTAKTRMA